MLKQLQSAYLAMSRWKAGETSARDAVRDHGRRCLLLHKSLRLSKARLPEKKAGSIHNRILWQWYPKFHLSEHIIYFQLYVQGNPLLPWCYHDESEISSACAIARSAHPNTIHRLVLVKHNM